MSDTLARLAAWHLSQCNGEREHAHGIKVDTLDDPGWTIDIDLAGTTLVDAPFGVHEDRYDHEVSWLRCWTEAAVFHAACGPGRLEDALRVYRSWAESYHGAAGWDDPPPQPTGSAGGR